MVIVLILKWLMVLSFVFSIMLGGWFRKMILRLLVFMIIVFMVWSMVRVLRCILC